MIKCSARLPSMAVLLAALCPSPPTMARPGDLDVSFNSTGKVITDMSASGFAVVRAFAAAIQPDGKLVVGGSASGANGKSDFLLVRYDANGKLDPTFGVGGMTTTDFFPNGNDEISGIAIQPDGRIVVAGVAGRFMSVARYNTNGSLDGSFGTAGKVTTDFPSTADDEGKAVALQGDGRIVVVGQAAVNFAVARYNANGSLDTTFDGDGLFTSSAMGVATDVAIQSDGRLVVVGAVGGNNGDFAVARFNTNGTLDSTFDGDGVVTTDFGITFDGANAVAIQADGKLVVAGSASSDLALARYDGAGRLDSSFSNDGKVIVGFGTDESDSALSVEIQRDGKLVVAGATDLDFSSAASHDSNFAVARFNSDGTLDGTFGNSGKVTTDFGDRTDRASTVLLQPGNGRLLAIGRSDNFTTETGNTALLALARYHAYECGGKDVTVLGTNGADSLRGARVIRDLGNISVIADLPDVILGLNGADTIDGLGGNDTICGGDGGDVVRGGSGDDVLLGGGGTDSLDGESGVDTCVDDATTTFANCETVNNGQSGVSGLWESVAQHCNASDPRASCWVKGTLSVTNPRSESTEVPFTVALFMSADDVWDGSDRLVEVVELRPLAGGKATPVKLNERLGASESAVGSYLIGVLDLFDTVPEANEANNVVVSGPVQ